MLENLSFRDKSIVLMRTGIKAARGLRRRCWLGKVHGLLLVGAHVTISCAWNIRCGKNVKFEDYSEIQGLCSDGLHFGNDVTIGRGVMIRPSSYYGGLSAVDWRLAIILQSDRTDMLGAPAK